MNTFFNQHKCKCDVKCHVFNWSIANVTYLKVSNKQKKIRLFMQLLSPSTTKGVLNNLGSGLDCGFSEAQPTDYLTRGVWSLHQVGVNHSITSTAGTRVKPKTAKCL